VNWLRAFSAHAMVRFCASKYWKDVAWLAFGTTLSQVMVFATLPLISRLFGPAQFALQHLFSQTAGFLTIVATLRFEYFVQLPGRHRDGTRILQLVALMGGCGLILLTPPAWLFRESISRWLGDAALAPWILLLPVTAAVISMGVAMQGEAQRHGQFRRSGQAEVFAKGIYIFGVLAGWLVLPGAGGLMLGFLGGYLGKMAWLWRESSLKHCQGLRPILHQGRKYFRLAGSLAGSSGLYSATVVIPVLFISHVYGTDRLGQYSLAFMSVSLPSTFLGAAIGGVFYQRAAERWAQGSQFLDIWWSTAKKLLIIGAPLHILAILILPDLFPWLFGTVWRPAGKYAAILAVGAFFNFISSPMDKSSLVVRIWWYIPLWHAMRTAATGIVAGLAMHLHWDLDRFVLVLTIQQGLLYLVDLVSGWHFASRRPGEVVR